MKTYEIKIKPLSGFGTPLKGDTLFGQICWQAAYDEKLFGASISNLLKDYSDNPFLVVSSAFPIINNSYALKRPDLPQSVLFDFASSNKKDTIEKRKELKAKWWMMVSKEKPLKNLRTHEIYLNDRELFNLFVSSGSDEIKRLTGKRSKGSYLTEFTQPHNSINRILGTTGEGDMFSPYTVDQVVFVPGATLAIFAGLREDIKIEQLTTALSRIGKTGFGKDASIGLGKFEVAGFSEVKIEELGVENFNALYTLSPSLPQENEFTDIFFTPFVRFGRHGDILATSGKPFKNPVIMADEGAVLILRENAIKKPYIGSAIRDLSKANKETVCQGYSLFIPIKVEGINE